MCTLALMRCLSCDFKAQFLWNFTNISTTKTQNHGLYVTFENFSLCIQFTSCKKNDLTRFFYEAEIKHQSIEPFQCQLNLCQKLVDRWMNNLFASIYTFTFVSKWVIRQCISLCLVESPEDGFMSYPSNSVTRKLVEELTR